MNFKAKIYTDETAAREHLEKLQWPDGPVCPHCGVVDAAYKLEGESTRAGVYKCKGCEKPFSVTVGTVFERSHVPLTKWLLATELLTSSKKGMSAHQLHRMLGVTYKTAWFMAHRIREAMAPKKASPIGGEDKTVEIDETFIGQKVGKKKKRGVAHKHMVVALVERGGRIVSFHVNDNMTREQAGEILFRNADLKSHLMSDDAGFYKGPGDFYETHQTVEHSTGEYVRYTKVTDIHTKKRWPIAHTNTIEGAFSIFKRGMVGVYQHCGEQHLHRYLTEFDFRYNNRAALKVDDAQRAEIALKGIRDKRLTYRRINGS